MASENCEHHAALVTLLNLMEDMQNHPRLSTSLDKKLLKSLDEKVHFLLNFAETYNFSGSSKEIEDLESQITSAAHEAEDVIESHIVDQILAASSSSFSLNLQKKIRDVRKTVREKIQSKDAKSRLQKVVKNMDYMKKKMVKVEIGEKSVVSTSSRSIITTSRKTTMVGFEEELIQLMDVLTSQKSSRQIISIVGMGGAGKTTLTTNAFQNSLIQQYFDIRAWATVSQEYSAREIILQLLSCGKSTSETDDELGEKLYKKLLGKRYLVVLDDMWSIDAWDEMKCFLPDNGHRSRIVITTRLSNLASHVIRHLEMTFLDKDKSWKLFCYKAFGDDECPPELVGSGKEIVGQCQGLPLSIVVVAGYLSKSSRSNEHWQNIAHDINTVLCSRKDNQCLTILSLSYSHLPVYLKPCFLYMGSFPEDKEIFVDEVIRLWVAEGFLKPSKFQSLEETGESYFKDLVDRNLILAHSWGHNGKIMFCKIHDLLREVCLKEAEKEKFLFVLNLLDSNTPRSINRERRVAIHGGTLDGVYCDRKLLHALNSALLLRSFKGDAHDFPFDFKLLKIQNMVSDYPDNFDARYLETKFHQQVNLRYLNNNLYFDKNPSPLLYLPSSISQFWNLQTLLLHGNFEGVIAPHEIWEMLQLRHLISGLIYLPDPPPSDQQHGIVLQNLQTLKEVGNFRLSLEVCKRIPNIKDFRISYNVKATNCSNNLGLLRKLESLTCLFSEERISRDFALSLIFPSSLKELCLIRCILHKENLRSIGLLPFLEVLKLGFSIKGKEWNPSEGEFRRLKYLEIWCWDDLVNWNAHNSHFPVLESLTLRRLSKLGEIPSGIGEIPTLKHIRLESCSMAATISAMRILVEQESLGNESLQLEVRLWNQEDHQSFREMVEEEGPDSNNLRLSNYIYKFGEKQSKEIEDAKGRL